MAHLAMYHLSMVHLEVNHYSLHGSPGDVSPIHDSPGSESLLPAWFTYP
jgi:hypothetical protein